MPFDRPGVSNSGQSNATDVPVVILCGGLGTRMRGEVDGLPKPLVAIGGRPILWHIMKIYSHFGYRHFILCLGYLGEQIKNYFLNYPYLASDFTLHLERDAGVDSAVEFHNERDERDWKITFAETGLETPTGGRIKKVAPYIQTDYFLATYGDGVADIDIPALVKFHQQCGALATLTAIQPFNQFGVLDVGPDGMAQAFHEKPRMKEWVNGGFFVFQRGIFDYLTADAVLEREPLERLVAANQLAVYQHCGFWQCMDTFRDVQNLNGLWKNGQASWSIWKG
ncbi:MAG: glucose-1-phosphate cytidylyltransferase [Chloroflexi bacterium]|nr:glucose-1-phosphate cytidylyltransferase [Chloroflexota bacterium]